MYHSLISSHHLISSLSVPIVQYVPSSIDSVMCQIYFFHSNPKLKLTKLTKLTILTILPNIKTKIFSWRSSVCTRLWNAFWNAFQERPAIGWIHWRESARRQRRGHQSTKINPPSRKCGQNRTISDCDDSRADKSSRCVTRRIRASR